MGFQHPGHGKYCRSHADSVTHHGSGCVAAQWETPLVWHHELAVELLAVHAGGGGGGPGLLWKLGLRLLGGREEEHEKCMPSRQPASPSIILHPGQPLPLPLRHAMLLLRSRAGIVSHNGTTIVGISFSCSSRRKSVALQKMSPSQFLNSFADL